MTIVVRPLPVVGDETEIRSGEVVSGRTWRAMVSTTNTVLGRGAQLVPAYAPMTVLTNGGTFDFELRVRPRFQAAERIWYYTAVASTTDGITELDVTAPATTGTLETVEVLDDTASQTTYQYREERASHADSEETISIRFEPQDGDIRLLSLACIEVPRPRLRTTGNDLGIDPVRTGVGQPIWMDSAGTDVGLYRLAQALDTPIDIGRRCGHFMWAVPQAAAFVSTTATTTLTGTTLFADAFPLLGRALALDSATGLAATTHTLSIRAMARMTTGGGNGEIVLTAGSGDSATISVSGTSFALHPSTGGDPATLDVDSELASASDGLRTGSTWDDITVEYRKTSGGGSIEVAGLSIWED